MRNPSDQMLTDLLDQLGKAEDGGFEGRIALGSEDPRARELETRLNGLLDAARAGAARKGPGEKGAGEKGVGEKFRLFFDSILENAPVMLFLKNAQDLRVEHWNKVCEEVSGVKREDILGKTGFESFPVEDMEAYQQRDWEVVRAKKLVAGEESITSP